VHSTHGDRRPDGHRLEPPAASLTLMTSRETAGLRSSSTAR